MTRRWTILGTQIRLIWIGISLNTERLRRITRVILFGLMNSYKSCWIIDIIILIHVLLKYDTLIKLINAICEYYNHCNAVCVEIMNVKQMFDSKYDYEAGRIHMEIKYDPYKYIKPNRLEFRSDFTIQEDRASDTVNKHTSTEKEAIKVGEIEINPIIKESNKFVNEGQIEKSLENEDIIHKSEEPFIEKAKVVTISYEDFDKLNLKPLSQNPNDNIIKNNFFDEPITLPPYDSRVESTPCFIKTMTNISERTNFN
jgi:hypothetical protein